MSTPRYCTNPTTRSAQIQQGTEPPLSVAHQGSLPVSGASDNSIKSEFDPDKGHHETKGPSVAGAGGAAGSSAAPARSFEVAEEGKGKASSGASRLVEMEPQVELEANGLVRRVFRMPDGRRLTQYLHIEYITAGSLKEGKTT